MIDTNEANKTVLVFGIATAKWNRSEEQGPL